MRFLLSGITLLLIDLAFLYVMAPTFQSQILSVQGSPLRLNPLGALLSYAFLIFGLNYFIIKDKRSVKDAFLFGLVLYGLYETTTLALLKNWRLQTVLVDTLWGGTLFALTTALVYRFF